MDRVPPPPPSNVSALDRRALLGAGAAAAALACAATGAPSQELGAVSSAPRGSGRAPRQNHPVLVGSANALSGMQKHYASLQGGAQPLDVAIEIVKLVEADPKDTSVGLGGLPNEDGVVQLDAACMHGPTHHSGAVACLENILHPSEVARLVMERTDHCLLVGKGAYEFARAHGHPHVELLTEESRQAWLKWKEHLSDQDDWLPPAEPAGLGGKKTGRLGHSGLEDARFAAAHGLPFTWGTIHCSALSVRGEVACTTTTSGLAWKIPGRVGDSPIVGAGLYCDQEAGSAGSTGRGEASILSNGSFAIVELMRQGASPKDAGLEVLRRIVRQTQRQSEWQPALLRADGTPDFNISFYVLGLDGTWAGVVLHGGERTVFSVADPEGGPRHERCEALLPS
jgi:N4-(beta-N-acetylglucosaminyl)-L-asparaginase